MRYRFYVSLGVKPDNDKRYLEHRDAYKRADYLICKRDGDITERGGEHKDYHIGKEQQQDIFAVDYFYQLDFFPAVDNVRLEQRDKPEEQYRTERRNEDARLPYRHQPKAERDERRRYHAVDKCVEKIFPQRAFRHVAPDEPFRKEKPAYHAEQQEYNDNYNVCKNFGNEHGDGGVYRHGERLRAFDERGDTAVYRRSQPVVAKHRLNRFHRVVPIERIERRRKAVFKRGEVYLRFRKYARYFRNERIDGRGQPGQQHRQSYDEPERDSSERREKIFQACEKVFYTLCYHSLSLCFSRVRAVCCLYNSKTPCKNQVFDANARPAALIWARHKLYGRGAPLFT